MTPDQLTRLALEEELKIVENLFLQDERRRKTVIFTAPDRRSGCSWIVARTARCLARSAPGSVCALDANLRWPALHDLFWLDNTRGLLQALEGSDPIRNYTQHVHNTNLWVLPSGGSVDDSHRALGSQAFKTRISELSRDFDFLLVDTAAIKASPDAGTLSGLTDGVVLVLAANSTTRERAISSKLVLEAACLPIAGAVLNRRTYPIPEKIYQYL
jgi:Mrp family chromosome partitioning ATPase